MQSINAPWALTPEQVLEAAAGGVLHPGRRILGEARAEVFQGPLWAFSAFARCFGYHAES